MTKQRDVRERLERANESLQRDPDCPYHLVKRSIAILLQDEDSTFTLEDAEADLLKAYESDPKHLESIEELAHYYDAVVPDQAKARRYAQLCRDAASQLIREMDEILADE